MVFTDIAQSTSVSSLRKLFYPDSIAVIGASNSQGKLGYNIFRNLLDHNYQGKLYPINPKDAEIQGIKAFKSISDIKDDIDEAIIIVPAKQSPAIIKQCCEKGVKFIINEAAGFSETGAEGKAIEQEMKQILRNSGSRMVGPNCSGLINTHHNVVQSLAPVGPLEKGNIGLIAQAGVYASGMLWGFRQIMKFGMIITVGNKLDINETDILEFVGTDENIGLVMMYLEDIKAGRRFIDVAGEITRTKPIIALKGGRTEIGRKAAASHTASLAGNAAVYNAAFKQSGIIIANHFRDMFNIGKAFAKLPLPTGPGVMIITYTGAMGVTGADACYENGLRLAELSADSIEQLKTIVPSYVTAKNPTDLAFDQTPEQVLDVLRICASDKDVSAFIIVLQAQMIEEYLAKVQKIDLHGKPLLISIPGRNFAPAGMKFERMGYPVYDAPETAVEVLSKMYWFYKRKNSL